MASVLVCEDDGDIAELVATLLEADGHVVRSVGTVADAVDALTGQPPEVVVCDLGLPDGNGAEVCAAARRAGAGIVVVTAVPAEAHPPAVAASADYVLRKPFAAAALQAAVNATAAASSSRRP